MPEALARAPRGPILTAPVREAPPKKRKATLAAKIWSRLRPKTASGYLTLIVVAVMIGVAVNALLLQRVRHPAPFFASEPLPAPAVAAPPTPLAAAPPPPPVLPAKAPAETGPATPPPRPVELATTAPVSPPTRANDPIGELVRANSAKESAKTIAAVQAALIRLGYVVKADGAMGGDTEEAIRDFEKNHNLPISTALSSRLLAKLGVIAR